MMVLLLLLLVLVLVLVLVKGFKGAGNYGGFGREDVSLRQCI